MTIKERNNTNKIKTISLFSGAGGLDIGAIMAGAHIVFANDMMKEACMSYSTNIGSHIINGDINSVMNRLDGIEDVDMAEEMTEYTKYNVLQQAGTSVLAQANELPTQALQLLQ